MKSARIQNPLPVLVLLLIVVMSGQVSAQGSVTLSLPRLITDAQGSSTATTRNETVKIVNTTAQAYTVASVSKTGTNAADFKISGVAAASVVPANGDLTFTVRFEPGGASSVRTATLTITPQNTAQPTLTLPMRGLVEVPNGGSYADEASLQYIFNTLEIPVDVGDDNDATVNISDSVVEGKVLGDEIAAQTFVRAVASQPVTVEPLAAYGPANETPMVTVGWYQPGNTVSNLSGSIFQLNTSPTGNVKRLYPQTSSGDAILEANPTSQQFGFYTHWLYPDPRYLYTQDQMNTAFHPDNPHHMLVYPMRRPNGTTEPHAYIIVTEAVTTYYDFQDVVFVVRNVQPATATPTLVVDGSATPRTVLTGQTVTINATVRNTGLGVARNVQITAPLPAGTIFGSGTGCSETGDLVTCSIGDLLTDAQAQVSFTITPNTASSYSLPVTATANGTDWTEQVAYTVNPRPGSLTVVHDTQPDSDVEFTYTLSSAAPFTLTDGGTRVFNSLTLGSFTLTTQPAAGWALSAIACTDPDSGTTTSVANASAVIDVDDGEAITCTFTHRNDAPVAADDSAQVAKGGSVEINVKANDTDAQGALGAVVIASTPAHGTAVVGGNGSVTYTHNGDTATTDSFTYTVSDAAGAVSNAATVSVAIQQPQPTDDPTPAPTDEPTPAPTDDPTPQPTDEPTPVPTDMPTVNPLVSNGGFEVNADGDKLPDGWKGKNLSGDKLVCNKNGKVKAYEGECTLQLKGVRGEAGVFIHKVADPTMVAPGDTLTLSAMVWSKKMRETAPVTVVIKGAGQKTRLTLTVTKGALNPYQPFEGTKLVDFAPTQIKVKVGGLKQKGKYRVDNLSLTVTKAPPAAPLMFGG